MQKRIKDIYFNVNFSSSVTIILEPSEEKWDKIYGNCLSFIMNLPGRVNKIYFLGNKREYQIFIPQDFEMNGTGWFRENIKRPCLIGGILENLLNEGGRGMIVVIFSKEIIDIKDWENSEIFERMVFVNVNEEKLTNFQRFENPVEKIYIRGKGFFPLVYKMKPENIKSFVEYRDGEFTIKINGNLENLEGHLKVICSDENPKLFIKRSKGSPEEIILKDENPWFNNPEWISIPEDLIEVINAGIMKKEYRCPICGKNHRYDRLLCPEGGSILKGFPHNKTILIKRKEYLPLSDWIAFPLKNNERVITDEGIIYDWKDGRWERKKMIDLYEEVDDEIWGIFHRI